MPLINSFFSIAKATSEAEPSPIGGKKLVFLLLSILGSPVALADCDPTTYECQLAVKFAPKFWFYRDPDRIRVEEVYFPSDIEFFLDASRLRIRHRRGGNCKKDVLPGAPPSHLDKNFVTVLDGRRCRKNTDRRSPSDRKTHTGKRDYFIDVFGSREAEVHRGYDPRVYGEAAAPVYASVLARTSEADPERVQSYELQYYVFFPRDRNHAGDWEGVVVHLTADGQPIAVHAFAHGHPTETSLQVEDMFFSNDQGEEVQGIANWSGDYSHPVVFVAHDKHGTYLTAGTKSRGWIFLYDDKRSRGISWRSHLNVSLLPSPIDAAGEDAWIRYAGRWGARFGRGFLRDKVNSPKGPIAKPRFCRGYDAGQLDLGKYPAHCSPDCSSNDNWVKVHVSPVDLLSIVDPLRIQDPLTDPALSDTHRWALPFGTTFENADYALMDFDNQVGALEYCLRSIPNYYIFEHKNFGGKSYAVSGRGEEHLLITAPDLGGVSSSAFDSCGTVGQSWISFFKNNAYRGKSYLLRPHIPGEYRNLQDIDGMIGEISSLRWCLPPNMVFKAYRETNKGGFSQEFVGTGRIEERDLSKSGTNSRLNDHLRSGELLISPDTGPPQGLRQWRTRRLPWAASLGAALVGSDSPNLRTTIGISRNIPVARNLRLQPRVELINDSENTWVFSLPVHWLFSDLSNYWHLGPSIHVADSESGAEMLAGFTFGIEHERVLGDRPAFSDVTVIAGSDVRASLRLGVRF